MWSRVSVAIIATALVFWGALTGLTSTGRAVDAASVPASSNVEYVCTSVNGTVGDFLGFQLLIDSTEYYGLKKFTGRFSPICPTCSVDSVQWNLVKSQPSNIEVDFESMEGTIKIHLNSLVGPLQYEAELSTLYLSDGNPLRYICRRPS